MSFVYAGAKRKTCLFPGYAPGGIFFQRPIPGPGGVFSPRQAPGPGTAFRQQSAPQEAASASGAASPTSPSSGATPGQNAAPAVSLPFSQDVPQAQPGFFPEDMPKAWPGSAGAAFAPAKGVTADGTHENGAAQGLPARLEKMMEVPPSLTSVPEEMMEVPPSLTNVPEKKKTREPLIGRFVDLGAIYAFSDKTTLMTANRWDFRKHFTAN